MKRILCLVFIKLSLCMGTSFGAIVFDENGRWHTTFDCSEQNTTGAINCDGLELGGAGSTGFLPTEITSAANNPSGKGGLGGRFFVGSGTNINSQPLRVNWPGREPELWIRWMMRYQNGFTWSSLNYHKHLYIRTEAGTDVIPEFYTNRYAVVAQGTSNYFQVQSTAPEGGFSTVMGQGTGNGLFHTYEIHIKMDTNRSNGVGRLWIDGKLIAENLSVDWSDGNGTAQQGWTNFHFMSNQTTVAGGPYYVDYDDIVVFRKAPPNMDSHGNRFIGPIGWPGAAPSPSPSPPSPPTGLRVISQ